MATQDKTEADKKAAEVIAKNTAEAKATLAALEASYEGTGWVVADGKALTTNRGVVAEGAAIGPLDFRYPEDFEVRKKDGHIVADPKAK
jgi:glutamine cyclotransferase